MGINSAQWYSLHILGDVALSDILLLGTDEPEVACVAFVPGHPEHPLKQYPNKAAFFASLETHLLSRKFQHYFKRFIPLIHQLKVFAALREAQDYLDLQITAVALEQGLNSFVPTQMINRILDDARCLAGITPGVTPAFLQCLSNNFAYALAQHLMAGAGVGISAGEEDEGRAPSDCIEPLRSVRLPDGDTDLWRADLSRYRRAVPQHLPEQPDERGIYPVEAVSMIRINENWYVIELDPSLNKWRIQHPTNAKTYRPILEHNNAGAWHHSLEQPQHWNRLSLLRRLGHLTQGFSDERLLNLARISGVTNGQLREVYCNDRAAPALLRETITRARIHDDVARVMSLIAQGRPIPKDYIVPELHAFWKLLSEKAGRTANNQRSRRSPNPPTPAPSGTGQDQCELDEPCAPPPSDLFDEWLPQLFRAVAQYRYELAQVAPDLAVQELRRRYPTLPVLLAQSILDRARPSLIAQLQPDGNVPLELVEPASQLEDDAQLARALEGFEVPCMANRDTYVLAFGLLEFLPRWPAGTALLLRAQSAQGPELASIGAAGATTNIVYQDNDEGWFAVRPPQQVLHDRDTTQYGFYSSLLHALSETQRSQLGFGLNEPERLQQQLAELALARPVRARLLLGLPVNRPWLAPTTTEQVRRDNPQGGGAGLFSREPVHIRLQALVSRELAASRDTSTVAERYLAHLIRNDEPILPLVTRLETERSVLNNTLTAWVLSEADAERRMARVFAMGQVMRAWESRLLLQPAPLAFHDEFPPIPVDLPSVETLTVFSHNLTEIPGDSLRRLPNLQRLNLSNVPITQLPAQLAQLDQLRYLDLSGTRLRPAALAIIGQLQRLTHLHLYGITLPDLAWTPADMAAIVAGGSLQTLQMTNCAATFAPGVFAPLARLTNLQELFLSGNRIILAAADVSDLASLVHLRSLYLSGNPLALAPDLSRLQALESLDLSNTGITAWPQGLERLEHIRTALLDGLQIATVPQGAGSTPGLSLSRRAMSAQVRVRFDQEMTAVGNPLAGTDSDDESASSDEEVTHELRVADAHSRVSGLLEGVEAQERASIEELLADNSRAASMFFILLARISRGRQARTENNRMRERLLLVIRGALRSNLRKALFDQALEADSCVDLDALVFSQMESLVQADLALSQVDDDATASPLIELGISHWRMQRLKEHVAANLSNWRKLGKTIDHSEIELYFRIALTTRLGLRDQPTVQVYPKFAQWVTSEMLNDAQSNVLADQTALLPLYLNTQPYWQRFLAFHRSAQVNAINAWRDRIGEYLDLLTDNQWLPDRMPEGDAERLLQVLVDSGQPASTAVGQPLSKTQYEAAYAALLRRVEQAMLALTQAVLAEHATDPTEPTPGPSSRP
ncbi:Internalin-A precursor [compost metagenome]